MAEMHPRRAGPDNASGMCGVTVHSPEAGASKQTAAMPHCMTAASVPIGNAGLPADLRFLTAYA